MGQKLIDITGERRGMFTVLGFDHIEVKNGKSRSYWKCQCVCGNIKIVRKDLFYYPYSSVKSCGCWLKQEHKMRAKASNRDKDGKFIRRSK